MEYAYTVHVPKVLPVLLLTLCMYDMSVYLGTKHCHNELAFCNVFLAHQQQYYESPSKKDATVCSIKPEL